jgi:hypothetical protein
MADLFVWFVWFVDNKKNGGSALIAKGMSAFVIFPSFVPFVFPA